MKKIATFFLIIMHCFGYCQNKEIIFDTNRTLSEKLTNYNGKVVNILDDSPIENAQIIIDKIGVVAFTNKNGSFEFQAPENVAEIKIKKEGNISMSEVFITGQEQKSNIIFKMIPENLNDTQIKILKQKFIISDNSKHVDYHNEDFHNPNNRAGSKTSVPNTIRVLMPNGGIVTLSMDEYLKGVIPREVSPSWNANALKAQAVVARSYATVTFKHQSEGADVCTLTHCQAWSSTHYATTDQAVIQTSKFSIKYDGAIIEALFFGHCNGQNTKNNEAVWGGNPVPYLRSKSCVCGFSSYFGHGVGMCQEGDQRFALQGMSWQNIIKHYYTGVTIDQPNNTVNNIPTLTTPAAGANVAAPLNLTWTSSISGASYRLQVSKVNTGWTAANGFTTDASSNANTPVNYSAPGLLNYTWPNTDTAVANKPVVGNTYYWTVRSFSTATGTSSYSAVRSFKITSTTLNKTPLEDSSFILYPNPSNGEVTITFKSENKNSDLSLYDLSGNEVFIKKYFIEMGEKTIKENFRELKNGTYILILNNGEKILNQTLIIKN